MRYCVGAWSAVLLILWLAGCGTNSSQASQPDAPPTATALSNLVEAQLHSPAAVPGGAQGLNTQLNNPYGELVILTLSVTYPSGLMETMVDSTLIGSSVFSWTVPLDAGHGTATYRLTASGCGCGAGGLGSPPAALESVATGSFIVE